MFMSTICYHLSNNNGGILHQYQALAAGIKSVYGKRFCQRGGVACRSGWACLLTGLLLQYASPVKQWMAIPFFSLVICLNIVDSSFGAVLRNVVGVLIGTAQAMTIGLVVFLILGTKLSLAPAITCIFLASFCVAFPEGNHEMARKVALSQVGIIFVTAHSGQNGHSIYYLVRLVGTTLLGASCALVAVLIPVPGLACWEAGSSARSAITGYSELLKSLVEAFCAKNASTFSSIFLHAKFLARTSSASLDELNRTQMPASWEIRCCGLLPTFKRMTKGLNGLKLHLVGMTLALQSGTITLTPAVMSDILKGPLKRFGEKSKSILDLATKLSKVDEVLREKQTCLEEAKAELKVFDNIVMVAREETYYRDRAEEQSLDELLISSNPQGYNERDKIKQLLQTVVPTYFFLFNLRMFFTEAINMGDSGKISNKMHQIATSSHQIPTLQQNIPTPSVMQLVCEEASSSECAPCKCRYHNPEISWQEAYLKWLEEHGLKIDHAHFLRAFKISLSMAMAALGGIKFNVNYAFWANITVGFIIQNHQGGSFRMATLRLQGTVIGGIYGYLALLVTRDHLYLVLISLIPWVIILSYLRFSKIFGPAGVIAGLTAAIIMLGDQTQPVENFALIRITENFIGVLFLIVVETVVWPNRAVTLCRKELVSSLVDLRDCVAAVIAAYTGNYCSKHRELVVQEIKKLEQQLRVRFSEQVDLQSEAVLEPDLWNVPFCSEIYSKLFLIQGRMLDLLYFMVCSLHVATEDCLSEQLEKLVAPLQTSLVALEDEVLSSLNLLQEVLQVKKHKIAHLSKKRFAEYDVEKGVSSNLKFPYDSLIKMVGHVHPLLVLECRQRAIDGTPLTMKSTIDAFDVSYANVVTGFIAAKRENPSGPLLSNSAMLSFSAVTFSLQSLLRETVELEKAVHELLHFENPWSIVDFWETFPQQKWHINQTTQTYTS